MNKGRILVMAGLLAAALVCPAGGVFADVYVYRDSKGVLHFTNVPSSPKYTLFMRSSPPPVLFRYDSKAYDHLISRAAQRFSLPTHLIKAVIHAESGFNPRAVSPKGAKGLMQIMPQNYSFLDIRDPFNPMENIMGGARYLRDMLDRFKELRLALAAYNAGPEAVDKYNLRIPPYPETVDYVRRVLQYYKAYGQS